MDYNHVALFTRVVRTGSFTAAAAELGVPKSTVSRGVARLEEDLGVRLLQRTTRKLRLTEAGQAYYDAVGPSIVNLDEADAAVREHGAEPRGTVRITAPIDVTVGRVLAAFRRAHPTIRVEAVLLSRHVDLVAEGFDLAIRAGQLPDSSLVARRVGSSDMVVCGSSEYLRRRGVPQRVADLAEHDWVLLRAPSGRATIRLTGPSGEVTVDVKPGLVADNLLVCQAAIEEGAGLSLLPIQLVGPALEEGRLALVLPEHRYSAASLYIVLPSARQVPARVAVLRDFLFEALSKELAHTQRQCESKRAAKERRRAAG